MTQEGMPLPIEVPSNSEATKQNETESTGTRNLASTGYTGSTSMNRQLLERLSASDNSNIPATTLSLLQSTGGLPLSSFRNALYPSLTSGLPPGIQTQLLMGRPLLGHASAALAPTFSQFAPMGPYFEGHRPQNAGQRGRPNAKEIQDALDTLAAASLPQSSGMNLISGQSQLSGLSDLYDAEGSLPAVVFMDIDEESLSDYQCLLRKQIEFFEANTNDVTWNAQGRNKAILLGQVGIRCRHCAALPTWSRTRGAVYYSASLDGLYQAGQNMAKNHLFKHCRMIPQTTRDSLLKLRDCKRRAAGGKHYWSEGAQTYGIYQAHDGLRSKRSKIKAPPL